MTRITKALPLLLLLALIIGLGNGFRIDRRANQAMLVGQSFPHFSEKANSGIAFNNSQLKGKITLWHVWAPWCHTCEAEWEILISHQKQVHWVSMVYQDTLDHVQQWYRRLSDPFDQTIMDASGNLAFDLGVTGVPETFLIDTKGIIRAKWDGPLSPQRWHDKVLPMIRTLQEEAR